MSRGQREIMNKAFSAGVAPGGLRDKNQIKILICFIMDKVRHPLSKSDVALALQTYGIANYFETSNSFSEMISSGSIKKQNDGKYCITKEGKIIVEELSAKLPSLIKDRGLRAVRNYVERAKSEKENKVSIKENKYGFEVTCIISDGSFEMLKFSLYAPDIETACRMKNNFYKNPEDIYKNILLLVTKREEDA